MKSTLHTNVSTEKVQYPCLKRPCLEPGFHSRKIGFDNDYVVLFTSSTSGMVVYAGPVSIIGFGYYSNQWTEERFEPLPKGSNVVLEM